MPTALVPLANLTLSSNPTTVTFSAISQAYRDLVLICDTRNNDSRGGTMWFNINNNSDMTYNAGFYGTASSMGVVWQGASRIQNGQNVTSSTGRTQTILNALDYSTTNKKKSFIMKNSTADTFSAYTVSTHTGTAAISTLSISIEWGFAIGSTFALYGVVA